MTMKSLAVISMPGGELRRSSFHGEEWTLPGPTPEDGRAAFSESPRRPSFDDVVRAQQQRGRDGEAERFRRPQIDDQLEERRLLDRVLAVLCSIDDLVLVGGVQPK